MIRAPPGEPLNRVEHRVPELLLLVRATADADHLKTLRQLPLVGQVVERREQLAMGQVAGGAKDHQGRRVDRQALQPGHEGIVGIGRAQRRGCAHCFGAVFTAWPPNWLRSAATTRAE